MGAKFIALGMAFGRLPKNRNGRLGILLLAAAAALSVAQSRASADDSWSNPAGGSFQDGMNWSSGTAPAPGDNALFNLSGSPPYTVTFADNAQTGGLTVGSSAVEFDLGGWQYSVGTSTFFSTSSTVTGGLTVTNGTLNCNWSNYVSGATASLSVNNTGVFSPLDLFVQNGAQVNINAGGTLISSDAAQIGAAGSGTLNISGVGALWNYTGTNAALVLGENPGNQGTINVTSGGKLQCAGGIDIGLAGVGGMTVSDVTGGTRSTVMSWSTNVGWGGNGSLTISNGALYSVAHIMSIANQRGTFGSVTVGGAAGGFNAELDVTGQFLIADNEDGFNVPDYSGQLTVHAGGTVNANGGMVIGNEVNHIGTVTVDGGTLTAAPLQLHAGTVNLSDGNLTSNGNEAVGFGSANAAFNQSGGLHVAQLLNNGVPVGPATITIAKPGPNYMVSYTLSGGTLQANVVNNGRFTYSGGIFIGNLTNNSGATFSASSNVGINGSATNSGEFQLASSTIQSNVKDDSYSPAVTSGAVTIEGSFTQTATGTLDIQIAGPSNYDQLVVTGNASLAGTVQVDLVNGYVPAPSDQFQFIAAASLSGAFSQVTTSGGQFQVVPQNGGFVLTNFQQTPEPSAAFLIVVCTGSIIGLRRRKA